jgi:hypothetical protein
VPDLEQRLIELGEAIDWPAVPPFRTPVPGRAAPGPRRSAHLLRSRWLLAAAAALTIAALALGAYPPSRDAIAGWLNLHTGVVRVQQAPTPSPLPSGRLGSQLGLGDRTTLDGARGSVSWTISAPAALGQPDAVYLQQAADAPSGGEISLVYGQRAGIPVSGATGVSVLVTEAAGRVDQVFFQKILGGGASIEQVSVGGKPAYWITGTHSFVFVDAAGNPRFETLRIATNTLVVERGGTIVRIEGDLTQDQALAIARSLA